MTSSAASRDSTVKLTTESYQFWVAHFNLRVTFQSHIRFARKKCKNMVMRFQNPLVYKIRDKPFSLSKSLTVSCKSNVVYKMKGLVEQNNQSSVVVVVYTSAIF